ncbi:hypothetical protein BAUCODRAFT_44548, partial [Baudoinia panamericana UAMH 10762]
LIVGLASCFSLWIVPLIQQPRVSADAQAAIFVGVFERGGKYLQPTSRFFGIATLAMAAWAYYLGEAVWTYYAAAFVFMIAVAPWEIAMIFPINDKAAAFNDRLKKDGASALNDAEVKEQKELVNQWSRMHAVRFGLPILGAI